MPKINKKFSGKTAPPIDWLWAAILERQKVYGLSAIQLAEIGGTTYDLMRTYLNKSPWDWNREVRERVCEALGIKISVGPTMKNGIEVHL